MRLLKEDKLLTNNDFLIVGILFGCIFWIKFTMVGFFIGWFIMMAYQIIHKSSFKDLCIKVEYIILGVIIATIPYIIYFGYHYAILFSNIIILLIDALKKDKLLFLIVFIGALTSLSYMKRREYLHVIFMMLFTIIFVYIGVRKIIYYAFIFSGYLFFDMISIGILLDRFKLIDINIISVPFILVITLILSSNVYLMKYSKEDLPQYKFDKIISKYKYPTLLNYDFLDGEFYTVSDILPSERYFCKLNTPIKEMYEEQNKLVLDGHTDFVVTRDKKLKSTR